MTDAIGEVPKFNRSSGAESTALRRHDVPAYRVDALDVSSIRLLLATAELGSVAKGARRVGISQPSATVKLRRLESLLEVPLLERTSAGSRLTDAGEMVARAGIELVAAAQDVFAAAEAGHAGTERLTMAVTRGVAQFRLTHLLSSAHLSAVTIEVLELSTRSVAGAVRTGRADLGVLDGPFAPLGLRSVGIGAFSLVALVSPNHPLADVAATVNPTELMEAGLLLPSEGSGTRDVIEAHFAAAGFGMIGRLIEVDSTAGAVASMLTGRGVAILPDEQAQPLVGRGVAVRLVLTDEIVQPIRLCWTGTHPSHRLAARLVELVSVG